jgi:hypothetical protein
MSGRSIIQSFFRHSAFFRQRARRQYEIAQSYPSAAPREGDKFFFPRNVKGLPARRRGFHAAGGRERTPQAARFARPLNPPTRLCWLNILRSLSIGLETACTSHLLEPSP